MGIMFFCSLNMLYEWHIIYLSICSSIDWQYVGQLIIFFYTCGIWASRPRIIEMGEFSGHNSISRRGTPGTWIRGSIFNAMNLFHFFGRFSPFFFAKKFGKSSGNFDQIFSTSGKALEEM